MTIPPLERRIRRSFPVLRFLQAYMPYSLTGRMNKVSLRNVRLAGGITHSTVSANRVPCVWIIPPGSPSDRVLLYLHGGGFVYGLSPMHLPMVAELAKKMGMRALMVDYRLAPQYPFPAALDDCVTSYRWLLEQGIAPQDIVVAGDSAGGNLTITSLMKLRDDGDALPAAAACLSPVGDLTGSAGEFKDPLIPARAAEFFSRSYVRDHDAHDPLVSPMFGDWHGLPPLLIHAGEDEALRQDAVRIARLAESAGVDVRLEIYPRMWHVWQLYLSLPQAQQSLDDIAGFLNSHLEAVAQQPSIQMG